MTSMTEIMNMVENSISPSWHLIYNSEEVVDPNFYPLPLDYEEREDLKHDERRKNVHTDLALFVENVNLKLGWGRQVTPWNNDFVKSWKDRVPHGALATCFVEVFWSGALVYRAKYIPVDEGRALLPYPQYNAKGELFVDEKSFDFSIVELINSIDNAGENSLFKSYLYKLELIKN